MAQLDDVLAPVDAPVDETAVDASVAETLDYDSDETNDDEEIEDEEVAEEQVVEELPPIEAPVSLDAKAKELFAALPREAQEVFGNRIAEQDRKIRDVGTQLSQTRDKVYAEANNALAERYEQNSAVLEQYAQAIVGQAPDPRLLYSSNPEEVAYYHRAKYEHEQSLAQLQNMHLVAQQSTEQAALLRQQAGKQGAIEAWYAASQDNPDWFDPSTLNLKPEIQEEIESIGRELGIPIDLRVEFSEQGFGFGELDSSDIKALTAVMNIANEREAFKVKADKWDQYQSSKMAGVRAAKTAPKLTQPGIAGKPQGEKSALDLLYPDD
jgi:hypothetical protein